MNASKNFQKIKKSLSAPRFSTYERCADNPQQVIDLYLWNLQISSAFFERLAVCEIVVRNAIVCARQAEYGENWAFKKQFEISMHKPNRNKLIQARDNAQKKEQIIAELSFAFWQGFFTTRFKNNLWEKHWSKNIPNTDYKNTTKVHEKLDKIRKLRNRIAYHEPIFKNNLEHEYIQLMDIIGYFSQEIADWAQSWQKVSISLENRPSHKF